MSKRACVGGAASSLVSDAALLRLDVYGAGAHCDGAGIAAGSGPADLSRTFRGGELVTLDVPPGPHVLVVTTYADADATQILGRGCVEATLGAGAQICFDLTLATLDAGIVPDGDGGDADGGSAADLATPPDLGCSLGTVTSCGGCGIACSSAADNSVRACHGGVCTYTCAPGRVDCNAAIGHDTDGCECAGSGCCPGVTGCQTAHSDGAAETFFDCAALNTYDQTEALAACAAFAKAHGGGAANCELSYCNGDPSNITTLACSDQNAPPGLPCYCWGYGTSTNNTKSGHVSPSCQCTGSQDPLWH